MKKLFAVVFAMLLSLALVLPSMSEAAAMGDDASQQTEMKAPKAKKKAKKAKKSKKGKKAKKAKKAKKPAQY
jgi:Na+-transporting methylmalonyl-CoA/oxaloacetate decarboxylase gamma subunit